MGFVSVLLCLLRFLYRTKALRGHIEEDVVEVSPLDTDVEKVFHFYSDVKAVTLSGATTPSNALEVNRYGIYAGSEKIHTVVESI